MKIIKERRNVEKVRYSREFTRVGWERGDGYVFPCSKNGELNKDDKYYETWKKNYDYCVEHPDEYIDEGITSEKWEYTEPAVGLCSCGNEVELVNQYMGACQCGKCGQWYNLFGQELVDPEYLEE